MFVVPQALQLLFKTLSEWPLAAGFSLALAMVSLGNLDASRPFLRLRLGHLWDRYTKHQEHLEAPSPFELLSPECFLGVYSVLICDIRA